MSGTQFFQKTTDGLEKYKQDMQVGFTLAREMGLMSENILQFMENYISAQTKYVFREDVDRFRQNIENCIDNEELQSFLKNKISKIANNSNELQYGFECISVINDGIKEFRKDKKAENAENAERAEREKMRKKEEEEKVGELEDLEKMFKEL